ncbi:MAG: ATP-binding protein [Calditrichales bacterium]|nr:ATP-binding protein [Calditrichales bacterium]
MLIRYSIENFLCFNKRTELSMIPGKSRLLKTHRVKGRNTKDIGVLKSALIYGANASGKSCLIKSMNFAKNFILRGVKVGNDIPIRKFKLSEKSKSKPSRFEFEFKIKGFNYAYGFLLDYDKVIEEWLFQITKVSDKAIFERTTSQDEKVNISFPGIFFKSKKEEQFLEFIALGTRPNTLFITECYERNVSSNVRQIDPIINTINWFNNTLTIIFPNSKFQGLEFEFEKSSKLAKDFKTFMKIFDTGIDDIELKPVDFAKVKDIPDEIKNDLMSGLKKSSKTMVSDPIHNVTYALFKDENNKVKTFCLTSKHKMIDSNSYEYFEINEESDGTQRLIDLIPAIIDLFKGNKVFVIDELDRSLHPNLSNSILDISLSSTNDVLSQLIVTTHESSLLNLKKVRKDEIWFIEKNKNGEATLYSLEEFKPRFDKEIRKNYLLGRFGAIPSVSYFEKHKIVNEN